MFARICGCININLSSVRQTNQPVPAGQERRRDTQAVGSNLRPPTPTLTRRARELRDMERLRRHAAAMPEQMNQQFYEASRDNNLFFVQALINEDW